MLELKNEKIAIPVVLLAGLIWSFGPLVVRYMNEPNLVPWQYIFARGLTIFLILNLYLFFEEGKDFYKNYFKDRTVRYNWWNWSWYCNDNFHLLHYKYQCCCYFTLLSCHAFFYSITRFFIFKRKNFTKCLDSYIYCNSWNNNNSFG